METGWVEIDTISSVINAAGDKMVTNGNQDRITLSRKGGKAGHVATVKFGSASVPIYLSVTCSISPFYAAISGNCSPIRKSQGSWDVDSLWHWEQLQLLLQIQWRIKHTDNDERIAGPSVKFFCCAKI